MKRSATGRWAGCTLLTLAMATGTIGCGSGSSSSTGSTPPITPTAASTAVLVNMGDTPSDSVLECAVTISAMSFTNTSGTSAPVTIATPMTMELAHLRGTVAPLMMQSIPQGTYNAMSITLSSATITSMTSSHSPVQQVFSTPMTVNIPLSTPLTVGSNAMVMNLDLNLATSVGTGSGGAITFTPAFDASAETATGNASATPEQGGMMQVVGNVTGISSSTFTMGTLQGMSMSLATGSNTQYQGMNGQTISNMGMMSNGQIMTVNATLQPGGTWTANSVTAMMGSGGVMPIGMITATTGSSVTQLTMFPDNGIGAGMMASLLANGMTVNVGGSATYGIDDVGVSMSGLPITPQFDASHMAAGQNIAAVGSGAMSSGGGMMGGGGFMNMGSMTAAGFELEPQGLSGTVASASGSGFTLSLPSDSAFTLLTGATSVPVYQTAQTQMKGLTAVANGQNVAVYGYLFYNAGSYNFVAMQITAM
ncbi:MAG TPA: DUF5666 domain-containing protein [Acidobacteriaceae bacterium]|nr:DUF5666 domain-containing protein [Acidobacteriaceae bacterium]